MMTDCHFGIIASRYHDGELTPREALDFEAHMAQCAACRAQLDDYARLDTLMGLGQIAVPGPDFVERLKNLPDSTAPIRLWLDAARLGRVLIPMAACFCMVFGALLFSQVRRQDSAEPPSTAAMTTSAEEQIQASASEDTPILGLTLSETEQQYLFADEDTALAGLYQTTGNE